MPSWNKAEDTFLINNKDKLTNFELSKTPQLLKHGFRGVEKRLRVLGQYKTRDFKSRIATITNLQREEVSQMDLHKTKLDELLEEVSKRGFMSVRREILINRNYQFPKKLKPFKVGVISDTHFGSQYAQPTLLKYAYQTFKSEGITQVFHCGDVIEGNGKLYRGQVYEMFLHGADSMVDYVVKNYPKEKGITTYLIGGSHDYCFYAEDGIDVLRLISEKRKDLKYMGMFGADVKIGNIKIMMMHGDGGVAYARSYKMQKIIEQFPAGDKPNVLLLGHYHVTNELPLYRSMVGLQLPCFQSQTPYLRKKGLAPDVGFLILEIFPDKCGICHIKADWHFCHKVIKGDF